MESSKRYFLEKPKKKYAFIQIFPAWPGFQTHLLLHYKLRHKPTLVGHAGRILMVCFKLQLSRF